MSYIIQYLSLHSGSLTMHFYVVSDFRHSAECLILFSAFGPNKYWNLTNLKHKLGEMRGVRVRLGMDDTIRGADVIENQLFHGLAQAFLHPLATLLNPLGQQLRVTGREPPCNRASHGKCY